MRKIWTNPRFWLAIILVGGFICRLYRLHYPLLDWHSFRQADTASVTREFVRHDYPIWQPHYHDLSNVQSGLDNPEGYRMVEFPLVNYFESRLLRFFPEFDEVICQRLVSAIFSTASIWLLYQLILLVATLNPQNSPDEKNWSSTQIIALGSSAFFAFLPYAIYYGRTILPEPHQVFWLLASLVCFVQYLRRRQKLFWWSTLLTLAISLLIKPTSLFYGPIFLALIWMSEQIKGLTRWQYWTLATASFIPLIAWRQYILNFPEGIPANNWLLNGAINGNPPRWRPAWWRWIFYERLAKMFLGYGGLIFFALGLIPEEFKTRKQKITLTPLDYLAYAGTISCFAYLSVFATGNIRHDYYQYLCVPIVCLLCGRGLYKFYILCTDFITHTSVKKYSHFFAIISSVFILSVSFYFAGQQNWGKFNVNDWHKMYLGQTTNAILPTDALVIAHAFDGDTNFLFQTKRRGWPLGFDYEKKITQGAQYFIGTDTDDIYHSLKAKFDLIYQDENGYIFNLQQTSSNGIIEEGNREKNL